MEITPLAKAIISYCQFDARYNYLLNTMDRNDARCSKFLEQLDINKQEFDAIFRN